MLVRTSLNDSRVMYWEPAKWVARLRELRTDDRPLLFKVNLDAGGHGGFAGRYDKLRDSACDWSFLLTQLGIAE
jgi:oligopeptidase B